MATRKITITLDEDQVREIRDLVTAGRAANVSGFVKHAVKIALYDAAGWREMLKEGLRQTGGPPTKQERAWSTQSLIPLVESALAREQPHERAHPRRRRAHSSRPQ